MATAKKILMEGAKVVIYTKSTEKLKDLNTDNVLIIEGDVTDRENVKSAMEKGIEKFGAVDILINNAGVAKRENFLDTTEKDWDFHINVNMKGVFICIQEFIRNLARTNAERMQNNTEEVQRKSVLSQRESARNINKMVINISSGAGIYGVDEIAVYSATKAAVINLTQSLNEELKNLGIKWVAVCPASTNTKMFQGLFPEEKPADTPENVAEVIYKIITGEIKPNDMLYVDVFHHIHSHHLDN